MESVKQHGPTVLIDSGNALFKQPGADDKASRERAAFILEVMGRLGTQAMAAGTRDLVAGPQWLKTQAQKAKVPVLSANLVDDKGKAIFPASTIVVAGGKKIGLIGVSPEGPILSGGAKGTRAIPAVKAEAKKLRAAKVDAVMVLAAVPYADGLQLSRELGGAVDFIFQSHEGRGQGMAQRGEGNFVVPSGERGRMVGKLTLGLGGKGPFTDAQELERDQQTLKILDTQVTEVKKRVQMTSDPQAKQQLQQTLSQFQERQKQVKERVQAASKAGGRKMALEWMTLTEQFQSDPALEAEVRRIEPHGAAH